MENNFHALRTITELEEANLLRQNLCVLDPVGDLQWLNESIDWFLVSPLLIVSLNNYLYFWSSCVEQIPNRGISIMLDTFAEEDYEFLSDVQYLRSWIRIVSLS